VKESEISVKAELSLKLSIYYLRFLHSL
jgi:hypothetical protein